MDPLENGRKCFQAITWLILVNILVDSDCNNGAEGSADCNAGDGGSGD